MSNKTRRIEVTGVPGSGVDHIIKLLNNIFNNNINCVDIEESILFNETILTPSVDLDDDAINDFVIQKLDENTLYIILDSTPEICRKYLIKKGIDVHDSYYNIENLEELREQFLTIYQTCRGSYIDNVMYISTLLPDSTETIIEQTKSYLKSKE